MHVKTLLLLSGLLIGEIGFAKAQDNIPSWSFYYAKTLLMEGSANSFPGPQQITLKDGREVMVTFSYSKNPPAKCSLELRGNGTVIGNYNFAAEPSRDALTPSVSQASYFVIPAEEIVNSIPDGEDGVEVEFFYTDDVGNSELKVGTIVFKS